MRKEFFAILITCLISGPAYGANFDQLEQPKNLASAPAAAQKDDCVDDPRLETDLMDIMQTDTPQIRPFITITPEKFITLNKPVIDKLAGNAIICPKTSLLKDGSLSGKVSIDFHELWTQMQTAILDNNQERMKWLLSNFQSRPMAPQEILNLVRKLGMEQEQGEALYKALNRKADYFPSVIDFFVFTGGKASEPASVYIAFTPAEHEEIRKNNRDSGTIIFVDDLLNYAHKQGSQSALAEKLRAAGLTATPKRK